MDYFTELETIFVNLWWGSESNRVAWLEQELEFFRGHGLNTFFVEWLNDIPLIAVVVCHLVVFLFLWLLFYFFWSFTSALRDYDNGTNYKGFRRRK